MSRRNTSSSVTSSNRVPVGPIVAPTTTASVNVSTSQSLSRMFQCVSRYDPLAGYGETACPDEISYFALDCNNDDYYSPALPIVPSS